MSLLYHTFANKSRRSLVYHQFMDKQKKELLVDKSSFFVGWGEYIDAKGIKASSAKISCLHKLFAVCLPPSPPTRRSGVLTFAVFGEGRSDFGASHQSVVGKEWFRTHLKLRTLVSSREHPIRGRSHLRHSKTKIQHTGLVCCIFGWGEVIRTPE